MEPPASITSASRRERSSTLPIRRISPRLIALAGALEQELQRELDLARRQRVGDRAERAAGCRYGGRPEVGVV